MFDGDTYRPSDGSAFSVNENGPRVNSWSQSVTGLTIGNYGATFQFTAPEDDNGSYVDWWGPGIDAVEGMFSEPHPSNASILITEPGRYTVELYLSLQMNAAPPADTMTGFVVGRISTDTYEQTVESSKPLYPQSVSPFLYVTREMWVRQIEVDQGLANISPSGFFHRTAGTTAHVTGYGIGLTIYQQWPGATATTYPA